MAAESRNDPAIEEALRERARLGATGAELMQLVRELTGAVEPGAGHMLIVMYLKDTFGIPLRPLIDTGGWVGYGEGGSTSDAEVEELLGPHIARWLADQPR